MCSKFAGSLNMVFWTYVCITWAVFPFFLHNHKSYLLLSVCLIGRNLGRLFQDGVCNVLSVLFDYRCRYNESSWTHQQAFSL